MQRSLHASTDLDTPIKAFVQLWTGMIEDGDEELSEDEAYGLVLEMHPDLSRIMENTELPEEFVTEEGASWSPREHLAIHSVVERQLANDEIEGLVDLTIQYEKEGVLGTHEIRHVLGTAVSEMIRSGQTAGEAPSAEEHLKTVQKSYDHFVAAKR